MAAGLQADSFMSGANPPIQVQNTLHSLELNEHFSLCRRSTPHMHSLAHQHPRQAFTPILHQSSTILPAPHVMGTHQDSNFNMHLPRGTTRPSFAPVTAFRTTTQKSFSSSKGGRWAALHVCIAWKIYYHKQLKQKPNSLFGELTPPGTSLTDPERHEESDQPSCTHPNPDSPRGYLRIRSEAGKTTHWSNTGHPTVYVSCHNHTETQREELDQPPILHRLEKPGEKEKHRVHQAANVGGDIRLGASLDRKRQLERDSFIQVKRVKKETVDDKFNSPETFHDEPSSFSMSHTHSSSHTTPVQHISRSHLSLLYPNSSRCDGSTAAGGFLSYPGAELYPYQTASWEQLWSKGEDLHSRQTVMKENAGNTCKARRQTNTFHGAFMPPTYFPLALGVQETAYFRGRELLHPHHGNCHLHRHRSQFPHPGFLTTSC